MAVLSAGAPIVKVYHDKSMILPDVSRVLACLYEKDIKFKTHPVSSYKSLLRLQALSHAPVPFYDGPTFLEESREICHYIAETYEHHGYPFLLGKDSLERASIEQWLHHEEHAFNPPSRSLFCHLAFPLDDEEDDDVDLQKRKLDEVLEIYEQRLSDSEFLAGNKFTLADLVHLPNSHYITASDKFVYLYDSRKNVQRWWNAISTRDSWQKVLKDIKKVEQQCKQDELEKQQQQQWQREHPTTTRRQIRLDPRMHTSTKSQTILVPPPVGIISTSPMAPQAEKPLPSEISPDETPTSSLSTPTSHRSSAVQSKQATIFTTHIETPQASARSTPRIPEKSPVSIQRKMNFFTPPTSPATADKPPRIDADKSSIRDVSIPSGTTEADLPTKSKPSSSKEVSSNLHVFDFYKANSRIDEAGPYIEPTPQETSEMLEETSEMLDKFSETNGPSDATVQAKISPRSANEDPDQLSASGFYKIDSAATSADSQDKESVRYIDRTPQRPAETNYGRSNTQRATNTSPGKLPSTEAHQKLQAEQWHAATAGLTNLKGETDHIRPSPQVKSSKDVQQYSSQDAEQTRTRPRAQEPVSMDGQLAQGPGMTTRTPYTDQRRDVSSVRWQQVVDTQRIAEENEASSDHRGAVLPPYARPHAEAAKIVPANQRKDASLLKRVRDDDAQAIPFQTAYDDAHDTTQEARETASAPRQTRAEAHDISEGTGTYHSVSSRSQPIKASHDAAPPSKQAAFKGPRRSTTPYPGAQELIKEVRESPASRPTIPDDAQGSTDAEEIVKSSSLEAQLLDSRLADAFPPKQFLDEDGYGAVAPLQTGYTDDQHNRKQGRDPAASRRMMAQDAHDAFEETKMADSAPFKAETSDYRQAAALPQKQPPAKDPRTTTPFQKRYVGDEDTTKQSRPRQMAAQEVEDNFEETKAGDSWSFREQPSDTWQAPGPLPRHEEYDTRSTTTPFRETYPDTGGTTKESEDITSMPRQKAGEDAKGTFEETKFSESASPRAQPLDYQRTNDPSRKQEAIEPILGATSPLRKRYADVEGTTKHYRDTSFKPRKMEVQDAQDASEEADTHNSLRAQHLDAWRVATTPSNQAGAEDALSMSRSSPTRYSRDEETSKEPRAAASTPTHIAAQGARDAFRESKVADSTTSIEQPSDARAVVPLPIKEVCDAHRYPDTEGNTKEAKDTFEEKKHLDSASSRLQPLDSQRADAPSRTKEATEDPRRATSQFRKRHSDVEDAAKQSRENDFKRRQIVGQDAQGTHIETEASDFALPRDQSSDTWQAAATPTEQEATQDGSSLTPPSEKRSPTNEDTIEQPRGTVSTPRRITAEDANNTFQDSEHADSVSSREQPLSAWQPAVTPPRKEIEDSHSTTAAFQKTYPYEDSTKQASDTAFAPRKIGAEDTKYISKDTKVADSASPSTKSTYIPRAALPLSDQAKIEEHARDKGGESRETISAPKKMVSRDAQDTRVETKTIGSTSREQSLDHVQASSPLRETAAEDAPDVTRGAKQSFVDETKHSQDFKGTTKKSESTLQGPGSTLPTTQSLGAQDAQRTNGSFRTPTGEQWKDVSTQLQSDVQDIYKQPKSSSGHQKGLGSSVSQAEAESDDQAIMGEKIFSDSQVTSSKTQPTVSQGPIKVNRMPAVYQEDPLVAQDCHEQAQILSTGEEADGSTPKRRQAPVVPSTSEEKSTASAPPRAKVHDDHSTEEPSKRGTVDDRKEATPLLVQEPTSQVQRGTEVLQEAVDDEDTSIKLSTIDQWRLASAPLQDVTPNSGDNELGMPSIDQKPTPMNQKAILSAQGANEMIKSSPDQKVEQLAPTGAQTYDGQHAPPSLPGTARGERPGESVQMQAPTLTSRPRATPDAREAGDQEFVNTSDGQISKASKDTDDSAVIHEDVRDTSLSTNDDIDDSKTATSNANEAQGSGTWPDSTPSPVNARLATDDDFRRYLRNKGAQPPESTQAQTPLEARRESASTQNVPSDVLQITKFGKPTSTEGIAPTAGPASTLETQLAAPLRAEADHAEHKLAPSDKRTARAAQPLSSIELESLKEDASVSAADQTKTPQIIFRQQTRPPAPIRREVPSSDTQHDMKKIQEVTLDNLLTDDSAKPYVRPTSGDKPGILPGKGAESPKTTQATNSEDLRNSASTQDVPANAFGNFKKLGPHSTEQEAISSTPGQASDLDAQPDYAMGEVSPAAKKFAPSDLDSVNSAQQPSSVEIKKQKTIVAAAEQALPTAIGQQDTRGMREAPTSDIQHSLPEQKFTPSDQDLAHTTQLPSSTERMNEEIKDSSRSSQPLISVVPDQIKKSTTIGQQDISRAPGILKSPSSGAHHAPGKFQDVAPDAHHIDKSIPSQGKVSHLKPDFEPSEGPTPHVHSAIDEKTMRPPPSQAQSSDSKPDSTQNHNDERSTGFLPNQVAQQREETQAPPLPMGLNDSNLAQGVPADALGKVKSLEPPPIDQEATAPRVASELTPDTHLSIVPEEVDPTRQKLLLKDQDSAQSAQRSTLSEPTKEQSTVVAPDQVKASQTMFAQPDIALPPALANTKDPSSDSQLASQKLQEITPEVHRIDGPIPSQEQVPHAGHFSKPHKGPTPDPHGAIVEEPNAHTIGSKSAPHTQQDMVPGELSSDEKKFEVSDQDSDRDSQTPASAESMEEKTNVVASDQNMAQQTTFGHQAIMPAPGTNEASGEVLEVGPGDHQSSELTKPPIPSQKQDSHAGHSESYEGPNPDARGAAVGEKIPAPLVNQAHNAEAGSNSSPADGDVHPTSGDGPVIGLRREQEMQPAPVFQASLPSKALHDSISTKNVSADAFGKVEPLEATAEVTPADQRIAPSEPLPAVESRKEESAVAEAKQSKLSQPIIGQQDIRHVPEISEPLLDDDRSKESVSGKEQVSHDQRASEPREASTLKAQHAAPIRTEADHAEHKFTPSDKITARAAQPLSSVELESIKEDNSVSAADQTKSPQPIFRQQARPLAPITNEDPSSDTQHGTRKIEGVTLDNRPTDDSTKPLVPSHEQVPHAPQTIPGKKDKTPVPGTRDSPATNTQLDGLTMPLVSSEKQGSYAGSSTEPHEGPYPDDGAVVDKDTTKSLSSQAPQTIPGKKDKTPVPGTRDSPSLNTQLDGLTMPLVSSEKQGSYVGSSTEPHEGPYPDDGAVVDKDTKSPSGQAPVLEARPDLTPTDSYVRPSSGDEPGNLPGQGAESPTAAQATYSEDLHNSASTQDISANVGSFKKHGPHSTEQEAISSTPGKASDLHAQLDSAMGEVFPAAKKFAPSDQDSVNSAQRPSSAEARKEETVIAAAEQTLPTVIDQQDTQGMREAPTSDLDSAHSTQLPSSAEPRNEEIKDSARSAQPLFSALPDQTKKSTTVGQQDISPAIGTSKSPSSEPLSIVESRKEESQPIIGQQDTRNAPGISEPVLDDDTTPSSQAQISDPQRDSLPASVDVDPSSGHQSTTRSSPDQWAQLPERTKSPLPLEASLYSESIQDVPKSSKLPSPAREVLSPTVVPASAPDTQLGTASDKIAPVEQNLSLPGQDLTRSAQPPLSAKPTKEASTVAASDQTNDGRTIIGQQASMPATDKGKAPFSESYTQLASTKIQERTPSDDRIDESIPGQEQASLAGHASEPRGGTTTDSHGVNINDRITTSPHSQENISDAGSHSGPTRPGIHPSSGDEPTIRTIPEQGEQPPALTQDVSIDSSGKGKSTAQEVTTQPGSPRGEVASSEHKHTITDQDYVHSSQPPFSVEPQKQERNVAAVDQQHAPQTIFDRQIITPAPGARKSSREVQKASRDDLHASELAKPLNSELAKPLNVSQEQVPHAGSASEKREGPTLDVSGAVVDEKVPLPSSQAQNSDTRPASTPINAQPASGDGPATSSLLDSQAQPPAGTQAPVESIGSPRIIQNVPADSLGKKKLAGSPSTDEEVMAPMTSLAPAQDVPQGTTPGEATPAEPKFSLLDQDSTHSTRLSPPVESRKQVSSVAKSDQTNVSQSSAGPNVALPAAETESARSLRPMTGTEPVQPPHEASFNLSSDKKTTMTQGDQSNTLSDVSFSASQAVGQFESGAGKGALSEELISSYPQKNLGGTSTEEKVKQQQQTGLSSTKSSKDDNKDTNGTVSSITTSGGIQPSPPKENMESTEESRNENKDDQVVGQSSQDNEKQREETEARDTGKDEPEETDLHEYTNQKNSGTYQGVQPLRKNTKNVSKSTKGADYKSESSLRTSEEFKLQVQTEGKTQGGETKAPASKIEQPKERDLPSSSKSVASQSQAEASDKIEEQTSSSVQKTGKKPSKLDSSTNDTKSGDTEDNPSS